IGNYKLYHVENGSTVEMTLLGENEIAHNNFEYDAVTGDVTLYLASFSEIAVVADTVNAWEGEFDYTWYDENETEYVIANADQLAAFGAIVGGMDGQTRDNFSGKTVTLTSDINLGDKESENNPDIIFYPIGYYYNGDESAPYSTVYSFTGTFDGNGHTIANFYQNTWEIKGDYDGNYYKDGMGLFGYVVDGIVKNLTVDNFSSDGEFTPTGVIAAYAVNSTFTNIAITNCNPRVYNTGNGGIVGVGGNSDDVSDKDSENYGELNFSNITVDQSNTISALWGSWDVACGGIMGMFRGNGLVNMTNCHVAAMIDVNNDVCANYQYYWYRYSGMFIGSIRNNTTEGNYTVADITGITADGCTYTLGDWNEYWYCELVANSIASYTHDHQFSRLTKIANVSEIQDGNGNWNKAGNFVIPSADNTSATCYHIFKNSEGELYQHFHDVADESNPDIYETFDLNGDGLLNDLKEDRTCYYIPFNQIFNGYGYGVKAHYTFDGITDVKDGTVISGEKFEKVEGATTTYRPGQIIKIGDLFESIVDDTKLSKVSIFVAVSSKTENDNVKAVYQLDLSDWKNGTITFDENCTGTAKIIITDYFYCTPTVIYLEQEQKTEKFDANNVENQNAYTQITLGELFEVKNNVTLNDVIATVTDPNGNETTISGTNEDWSAKTVNLTKDGTWTIVIKDNSDYCLETTVSFTVNKVDKFKSNLTGDFLYRVGNANAVALGSIFSEIETTVDVSSVTATIENVAGNANGTYTPNATWTSGTIQFTGTGVVKITISADGTNDLSIYLEVVNATNVTKYSELKDQSSVFLNDITMSSGGTYRLTGTKALYGNGFTFDVRNGAYAGVDYDYMSYVIYVEDSRLDNVRIEGAVYPELGAYRTDNYNRAIVMTSGDCLITNCFISNGASPIRNGGNLELVNTTLKGGIWANLDLRNGHLILDNVTTINQINANDKY
ncbi:MAG: hypothetical protein IKA02_03425, partial [Clostridia bacterium]|nr:hypothetical protein [Clostridia bacterium]